jgi:hypothetical protein
MHSTHSEILCMVIVNRSWESAGCGKIETPLISRQIAVVFVDSVILSSDSEILLTACPPHAPSAVS